jgi:phosphoribosyl-AMP cyclohydrolase
MNTIDPAVVALLKDAQALIPTIVQDDTSNEVLMLAYMNAESLALTLSSGRATYFSRSRNELWVKGATSGHYQEVRSVTLDCDGDTLLLRVTQTGVACHTGERTCFHTPIELNDK